MPATPEAPLHVFRFRVEFHEAKLPPEETVGSSVPLCAGAFSECSGLEATMEPRVVKEGGRNWGVAQRAGAVTFGTVILKRGITTTDHLWTWFELVGTGSYASRLEVTIRVMDTSGAVVFAWKLKNAMPVKLKAPDLNAQGSAIGIEELHLAHEGLSRA